MSSSSELASALNTSASILYGAPEPGSTPSSGAGQGMVSHRKDGCEAYVAKHKLKELMGELAALVLYHQPEDVKGFLVERLQGLKALRDGDAAGAASSTAAGVGLFSDMDLDSMFDIFDIHSKGLITLEQYAQAMVALGVVDYDPAPEASVDGRLDKKSFVYIATRALKATMTGYATAAGPGA